MKRSQSSPPLNRQEQKASASRLVQRGPQPLALEQRFMFDGAAVADAAASTGTPDTHADSGLLHVVTDTGKTSAAFNAAVQQAEALAANYLQAPGSAQQLFVLFNGGKAAPSAEWQQAACDLTAAIRNGSLSLRLELRSNDELQGALGAFAALGTQGTPTIYLNADYAKTASADAIKAVLLEEIGHAFDSQLNQGSDSPGDEGHAFASLLLNGSANLEAVLADNDHRTLNIDGQSVAVEEAAPYGIAQVHFVPLPEGDVQTAQKAIAGSSAVSGVEKTVIAITATAENTIIVYDQWENGYEADINNPTNIYNATTNPGGTQIWGDGITANGTAPGTVDDIIHAGQTILLQNDVSPTKSPTAPATMEFDGRDKIGSTQAVSVVRAGWSQVPGTVLAGAVSVIDAGNAGKDYVIPIGENVDTVATGTNRLFEYTSLHIIATQDGTTVNVDKDGNGTTDITTILNQGQTLMVNGGVKAGAHITSDKGIGVYVIAGDVGSAYENRWFSITPREQWADSYYAPVSTTLAADPSYVVLYNPNATAIDIYYDTATTTGNKITVPANIANGTPGTNYVLMPASAAHFYTQDHSKFYAVGVIDADATSNATHDWSYSLVPESYLTTKFVVGWGPGYDLSASGTYSNGSPVWLTASDDTTIYIDNAASIQIKDAAGKTIAGAQVGSSSTWSFDVTALQSYRIFDNADKNQSGLTVYTTDGTLITAAWGEDPSIAGAGAPYLDMGTTVLPFPDYVFSKTSVEASPVSYSGASDGDTQVELGEQIEYTLSITNRAVIDLYNINIKDAIDSASVTAASYVPNSTTIKIIRADGSVALDTTTIPDDSIGTSPFPLAKLDGGYTLTDADPSTPGIDGLKRGDQVIIKYRVQVSSSIADLAAAGFTVKNDAEMTGNPAGVSTLIDPKTTTNTTIININGTSDGQVYLMDSAFVGSAATYQEGATIGIKVVDSDANQSTTLVDTLTVTVTNTTTGETEQVTLTETGANTSIFRNTLATSAAASGDNSGTLQMRVGDTIRADYTDPVYGVAFDNPTNPGVAGDADSNIATGNANTAYASVPVPSQTKTLYLSDDSTNNLDRIQPPASDTTPANTGLLVTSSGSVISITDEFGTSAASYAGGTGWNSNWLETNDDNVITTNNVRVVDADASAVVDYALILRANAVGASRTFSALGSNATLTFSVKDGSSTRPYEDLDYFSVQQYVGGGWAEVGKVYGSSIGSNYATQTFTLSAGATGLKFLAAANQSGDTSDRVYIDKINIASGVISTANTTGATDFAIASGASVGQSFTLINSGASTDAVAIEQLTLSLKKTGTTPATATVSIRNSWDGAALWSTTVSTSQLTTSYQDFVLAPTGLTLDKSGSYVIRVDSNASGIVWQGNTSSSYTDGARISSTGTSVSTSDMRFAIKGHETGLTSVTFSQSLSMATDFSIPASGVIKVVTHVTGETDLSGDSITASLSSNGTIFTTSSSPVYSSTNHTLTWTFNALSSVKTIAAGQSISLKISNTSTNAADHFKIAYDSYATPSRIELPTNTVINLGDADPVTSGVQEIAFFDKSFTNGGNPITGGFANAGDIVYVRVKVADPFGDYDISSLDLTIDGPGTTGDITLNMSDAYLVNATSDGLAYKTYEYAWQTLYNVGSYNLGVVAHEGSEGTVTDSATSSLLVTETDLGTPSTTMFRTALAANGGIEAGSIYAGGAHAYLRVTDLDESGHGTVTAIINDGTTSYTVTLTETSTVGIFEADLGNAAVHVGNTGSQTAVQAAAYFASLPNGATLSASYVDPNDSSDTSSDAITVNSPPTAADNTRSIGLDKQATGNLITDDNNGAAPGGVDTDPDAGQTLTVTKVNGASANLNDTITLISGARLLVKSDGTYIYDPSSLITPPTSGSPVNDTFTYTISDGQGGESTATVTVTVSYVNPIVIDNQNSTDGAVIEFDVSSKFADLATNYVLEFGTGSTLPSGLSIDLNTGLISGTIAANDSTSAGSHTYSVNVTATEYDPDTSAFIGTVTRNFTWTVTNVAPVATNDTAATHEGLALGGNVLSNDADGSPDSDTLTVTQFTVNGTTYAASSTPRNIAGIGTISIATTGAYTFTPDPAFKGGSVPAISYTITDGNGGSATATLNLSVIGVNDIAVNEGSPYAVFEVTGVANEQVSLGLVNGTASIDANGVPILDGSEDYGPTIQYSTDGGVNWGAYSSGTIALNALGKLLVRTEIINDTLYEGNHSFTLNATNNPGATDAGTATIHDDGTGLWFDGTSSTGSSTASAGSTLDDDRPAFSINDVTVNEAAGTMTFTVTKSGNTALASSVNYATADDTALAGSDYTATSGTLNFAAGDVSKTFTVSITNDALYEHAEGFKINLSGATNATISDSQGIGTIKDDGTGDATHGGTGSGTNDDRALSVSNISVNEASPYGVFSVSANIGETLSLALSDGTANGIGVDYGTTGSDSHVALQYSTDGGTSWGDYAAPITVPGSGTGSATVLVRSSITNDANFEGAETFTLTADYTSGIARSQTGTATIHDDGTGQWFDGTSGTGSSTASAGSTLDDDRPAFSINDVTVNEAAGTMTFTVTKSGNTALASSVNYATADDTALAGSDYTATSGTLNFAAGDLSKTFTVSITNDALYEHAEAFRINLSGATNATISDSQGIGTIKDDGTGDATHGGTGSGTNDDRALSVSNISVNEASPYGVFSVSANIGETLSLALSDGTANGIGVDYGTTGSDSHVALQYSTDGGTTWGDYTTPITVPGSGTGAATILVRSSITNDANFEGAETFTLTADYTSGIARSQTGTATIHDDGTGLWFDGTSGTGSSTAPAGSTLDDDRGMTVTGGAYNENSPRAIFTISTNPGQLLTLEIHDAASPGKNPSSGLSGASLYFSLDNGATWSLYGGPVTAGNLPVLVAVDITAERDNVYEGEEQLQLIVNAGQPTEASAYASIFDDNTGIVTDPIDTSTTHNTGTDNGTSKDDDRTVPPPLPQPPVTEPPTAPPVAQEPPPSNPPPAQIFDSTIVKPTSALAATPTPEKLVTPVIQDIAIRQAAESYTPIGEIYTSPTGFRIVVKEAPYSALTLFRGVADQYAESASKSSFAIPYDAFAHTDPNERITLAASMSDGTKLPSWVQFDSTSGKFEFAAPPDYQGELKIKVTARDTKGNEVSTLFRFSVGHKRAGIDGRPGFSEQLRQASRQAHFARPAPTEVGSAHLTDKAA